MTVSHKKGLNRSKGTAPKCALSSESPGLFYFACLLLLGSSSGLRAPARYAGHPRITYQINHLLVRSSSVSYLTFPNLTLLMYSRDYNGSFAGSL